MAVPPKLNPPRLGEPISTELSYVRRASAEKQATFWNMHLADDLTFGPTSGFTVGVAPTKNEEGRYQLIWVSAHDDGEQVENRPVEFILDGQHRDGDFRRALEEVERAENPPRNRAERRAAQRRRRPL